MSRYLYRLIFLAALFLMALLPVHAAPAPDQINLSCKGIFVQVDYVTGVAGTYFLKAVESATTYPLTQSSTGSTTTAWTGGTFHVSLVVDGGAITLDSGVITCPVPVTGTETGSSENSGGTPPKPVQWEGLPGDAEYDGRINATMADRYAVYCKAGQLQVWDSVTNSKVAATGYADILAMANPESVQIGGDVWLGHSNNTLEVAGPGSFVKGNIDMERCVTNGYRGVNDR